MRRLFLCAIASLALYLAAFAFVLDRPLSLGLLRLEMREKLARGATLPSPKLVILAGSNGPYSHSCRIIGTMLALPCENGGIAVGIGLDDLFLRWLHLLHRGDIVYLPMEVQQYDVTRAANRMDIDGAILFRHDRALLWRLPPGRILGAAFDNTMPDGLEALAEMAARAGGLGHLRARLAREEDAEGDEIGTSLATADRSFLAGLHRVEPSARAILDGYGTVLIGRFVAAATTRGVIVIGGLPTDFRDVKLPAADISAIRAVYRRHGGRFLELADRSRYPRNDFYNSEDHLAQPCQYFHSMLVARGLALMLRRHVVAPMPAMVRLAATCPQETLPPAQHSVQTSRASRTAGPARPAG
jgi:hypothetical protein